MNVKTTVKIYEFFAAPAHLWLWVLSKLMGGEFTCGPVEEMDDQVKDIKK